MKRTGGTAPLVAALAAVTAALFIHSQLLACGGDEGFHLMAAKRVAAGQRLYLDFFYQHVPLYPLLLAGWMKVFGETWRSAHALSALCSAGSAALAGLWFSSRLRGERWGNAAAVSAACFTALHGQVIVFGTVAHPYAPCLLFTMAAFHAACRHAEGPSRRRAFLAGLFAGAAAACSLLAAPVLPVLGVRLLRGPAARRSAAFFAAGALVPFLPLFTLAALGPRETWFNVVGYHLAERWRGWDSPIVRNVKTAAGWWIDMPQTLLLSLLAALGVLRPDQDALRRRELVLAAWLALSLGIFIACIVPTFPQYFVLLIPFLAVPAAQGLRALGAALFPRARPAMVVLPAVAVFALGAARPYSRALAQPRVTWPVLERAAREARAVTPPGGSILADEEVYFAGGDLAPDGLGNRYGTMMRAEARAKARVRALGDAEIAARVRNGAFDAAIYWVEDPRIRRYELAGHFDHRKTVGYFELFWGAGDR